MQSVRTRDVVFLCGTAHPGSENRNHRCYPCGGEVANKPSSVISSDYKATRMTRIQTVVAMYTLSILVGSLLVLAQQNPAQQAPQHPMTFFITSAGSGNGANLGGLAGADAICQARAAAVGVGTHTWQAYLSTQAANGQPAVNARDRIGTGPGTTPKARSSRKITPTYSN